MFAIDSHLVYSITLPKKNSGGGGVVTTPSLSKLLKYKMSCVCLRTSSVFRFGGVLGRLGSTAGGGFSAFAAAGLVVWAAAVVPPVDFPVAACFGVADRLRELPELEDPDPLELDRLELPLELLESESDPELKK